jgi:hypothetical protein
LIAGALDGLPPGYRVLAERAVAVFEADDRVRAGWIHGSRARDDADELSDLDLEENGRTPACGTADWSGRLTEAQREELLGLPTGEATRAGVVSGHRAVRDSFATRGRRALGEQWPSDLEASVTRYLEHI